MLTANVLDLEARLRLDKLYTDEQTAKKICDGVNKEIEETQSKLRTTVRASLRAITSLIGTMRSVASMFGIAIPPIFDAIMSAVTSTVIAMQAIAAAYTAGGITAALAIPVETAAIVLSWTAVLMVAMGRSDVERGLGTAESAMRSMGMTANAFERMLEGF